MTESEFWSRARRGGRGCLEWQRGKSKGYGYVFFEGKTWRAHRLAFCLFHRVEISSKDFVCHKCDNPSCIEPSHLVLADAGWNSADSVKKGRRPKGSKNWNARLRLSDVSNIRKYHVPGKGRAIARRLGISFSAYYHALHGSSWSSCSAKPVRTGSKGVRGEYHHLSKLSHSMVAAIRRTYRRGNGRFLAARYGVSPALISLVVNERRWRVA